MLSLFPQILFLAPLSATLIRLVLTLVLLYSAWQLFKQNDTLSRGTALIQVIVGGVLLAGAWTQAAAIAALVIIALHFFTPRLRSVALGTALLSIVLALSLLVTGPGAFAFDLPL